MTQVHLSKPQAKKIAKKATVISRTERLSGYHGSTSIGEQNVTFREMMDEIKGRGWFADQVGSQVFINCGSVVFTFTV